MITVRPARPVAMCLNNLLFQRAELIGDPSAIKVSRQADLRHGRALNSADHTLSQDRSVLGIRAVKMPGNIVQLLVFYYQCQQYEQCVECELQQWQCQQQQ